MVERHTKKGLGTRMRRDEAVQHKQMSECGAVTNDAPLSRGHLGKLRAKVPDLLCRHERRKRPDLRYSLFEGILVRIKRLLFDGELAPRRRIPRRRSFARACSRPEVSARARADSELCREISDRIS